MRRARAVDNVLGKMTETQELLMLVPAAYVGGSVPFGLLVGLARGIDVRKAGSGNIGATNVGRLLGGKYFAIVFGLDMLKGLLPMLSSGWVLGWQAADWRGYVLWLLVGFAAIAGHMFSLFLKFKGGKGVASSAGVALGLFPYYTVAALIAVGTWLVVFAATRIVSLSSMVAAVTFPTAYVIIGLMRGWKIVGEQTPLLIFASAVAVMIVYKHRANIARLRAGTEGQLMKR